MERKPKVLMVSSERDLAKAVKKALKDSCEVVVASSQKEGAEKALSESPDMIVLGYLDPRGTSFRFHKELRAEPTLQDIPLLIVDVRPEEHLQKGWKRNEGMQMNADDYITQPIIGSEFRKTVMKIIERAQRRGTPLELQQILAQMEEALQRIDKIEETLGARI